MVKEELLKIWKILNRIIVLEFRCTSNYELQNLLKNEGLYLGGSSAINLVGAVELAKQMGKGLFVLYYVILVRDMNLKSGIRSFLK